MIRFENLLGHSEYWYDGSDVAKAIMLKDSNGRIMGRNRFLQYLRFNGMLMLDSNQPKQINIQLGLMRWHMAKRKYKQFGMPLFSDRGIAYIQRKIANGDFQMGFTKRVDKHKNEVNINDVC